MQSINEMLSAERTERARLQSELELRNCALDAGSTHFMIIDVSGRSWAIVYVNRATCERHGYTAAELLGHSPLILVNTQTSEEALAKLREAVSTGTKASVEIEARHKQGSKFFVGMTLTPIKSESGNHYVWVGADITARLAQEKELRLAQKLESVGRLAAGIAHEINTPIQYVGDSVSFLQSAVSDFDKLRQEYRRAIERIAAHEPVDAVRESLQRMESDMDLEFMSVEIPKAFVRTLEGVERVTAIVRAMKEFAHPDSAQHCDADLNHALETTLTVARNEYKYHAAIETHFGAIPPVSCNVGELNQVFLNLIVNAAHALADSGKDVSTGRIDVATAAAGDHVTVSISDNGCGIPQEHLDRIFDPFFTTKPVGRGTGQGLALARSIVVEKHGGRIDVQSTVGNGTTFMLHLPLQGTNNTKGGQ